MHQQIMGFPGCEVDHRDRDGLNNQRGNLRKATDREQVINRLMKPGNTGFRGVKKKVHLFEARISDYGKYICLGHFKTAKEAAKAYDLAAKQIHGEFAVLNFPGLI